MTALRVLLLQLPVPNNPAINMPLAAGYLKAYADAHLAAEHPIASAPIVIDMLPRQLVDHAGDAHLVQAIVAHAPDVLGLSLYTWNSQRSLALAQRVKQILAHVLVIGGGPEVQRDNAWLLQHPALDVGVIGEGEQTFAALLHRLRSSRAITHLVDIDGLAYRDGNQVIFTAPRVPLNDLSTVPSPYLAGHLEVQPGGMALIEVSRWCPYTCSFCLYGRNMDPKLGRRYFGLERVLAEIAWARARGATAVHFVEANLNLVPFLRPLMRALADLNADRALALYAELRGEHLGEEVVALLDSAGLRVAEVGLQTANPVALAASQRRTNLRTWAAGTRRLLDHNIEVLLDVILGLPADDAEGVHATLAFIEHEGLGSYDTFMLQVLPGTAVREQADAFGITYQEHPPYYVLGTERMSYTVVRQLRHTLKVGAGLDPEASDGVPLPHYDALQKSVSTELLPASRSELPVDYITLPALTDRVLDQLANHVDLIVHGSDLPEITPTLSAALTANPSTLFDLYLIGDSAPDPAYLSAWRNDLPHQPGYLDFLTIYQRATPTPSRVSPRLWLVLPWTAQAEPQDYVPWAGIIWRYDLDPGETPPLGAWRSAGGAGIWVPGAATAQAAAWRDETGLMIWI